ncbi:MAG: AI-2E family transporter [Bacteroidales bacterium]|nr:AI-2E family transporter [Bacteroidales bacterium]
MQSIKNPLVTTAAAFVIIGGMHFAAPIVNLILLSFLLAMAVTPFMEWAIKKGMRPGLAVTITILAVVLVGVTLAGLMGVSISRMIEQLPAYQPRLVEVQKSLMAFLASMGIDSAGLFSSFQLDTPKIIQLATKLLSAGFGMLSMSLLIIMIVVFILIEAAGHLTKATKEGDTKSGMSRFFMFGGDVRKYLNIVALTGLLVGLLNTILLVILGVDFPIMWGVLSFLFNFVPSFGFIFSLLPPALLALLEFGWGKALIVVIGFVLINSASENIIKPRFMKKGLELSLVLILLSLIIWTWALGPMGTILGVPLTLVLYRMYREYDSAAAATTAGKS